MRNSLYVKLFVGFWLITTGILASWMLAARYFESLPGELVEVERPGPPPRFVLRLIYQLQNLPAEELPSLLERERRRHHVDVFLLNAAGEDLLGRDVPEVARMAAAQISPHQRRVFLKQERKPPVVAYAILRQDAGLMRAVLTTNRDHRHSMLRTLGDKLWLRILLAVVISGLLCYLLSRMMTQRLNRLRNAARELAAGRLDTRIAVRGDGGDEADELARSFNTMAEQLQRRVNAQKRLLSDVSHELRSPLARMKIALALAQERPEQSLAQLERIDRETQRLEELIGQLLSAQATDHPMDEHIDLVALLRNLCADADFEARANDKQVGLEAAPEQALVTTSGDLLRKTFDNILRNAVLYTPAGSRVTVRVNRSGAHYQVEVQDAGPGIPEDELAHIFDAFYRVDTARARDTGGYGLGLSIARRAVEQHGGNIRAENTDTGLLVTVLLPASDDIP
nr:ATP-binding protein [Parahaliea mediterranea]